MFRHGQEKKLEKMKVGGFPNGLAFDPTQGHLMTANISKLEDPAPITVSIVDVADEVLISDTVVPGPTRWVVFDSKREHFYVNISEPSEIVIVNSRDPDGITSSYEVPATGPHGLDIDLEGRRLFCACDQGGLFTIDLAVGKVSYASGLRGTPDVIFTIQSASISTSPLETPASSKSSIRKR